MRARSWAGIVAIAAMLAGPGAVRAHGDAAHEIENAESRPVANRWGASYFPNVPLVTQEGKTVRFYDDLIKGKRVAINFIYTSCNEVCPLETANLAQTYALLGGRAGREVFFYSISTDPERDTPAVLKAYAAKFNASWLFLTGKPDDIRLLGRKLGVLRERDEKPNSHHGPQLLLGDAPKGQWQRNSGVDDPGLLADRMATFFGWRETLPEKSYAEARPLTLPKGQRLFLSKCSACHNLGGGDKIGPDLAGVTARRSRAWLTRYISAPDAMLASGDPAASELFERYKEVRMPKLRLRSSDVADIVSFLDTQKR